MKGLKDSIRELHKLIGDDNFDYLSDWSVIRAISALKGEVCVNYKKQVSLKDAPIAERLQKLEELLGVEYSETKKVGYQKVKKTNK